VSPHVTEDSGKGPNSYFLAIFVVSRKTVKKLIQNLLGHLAMLQDFVSLKFPSQCFPLFIGFG
jgi:hypothetical protein